MAGAAREFAGLSLLAAAWLLAGEAARAHPDDTPIEPPASLTGDPHPPEGETRRFPKVRWRIEQRFLLDADFGASESSYAQTRARMKVTAPLSERVLLRFDLVGGTRLYDFGGEPEVFDGAPVNEIGPLYDTSLRLGARYRLLPRWSLFAGGVATARWEDGAQLGDGAKGGGFAAVGYATEGERFSVGVGARVSSRIDGSGVRVGPIALLDWRVTDWLRIKTAGLGLSLQSEVSETLELLLSGRLESRRFRIEDRGGAIGAGTLRDRQLPVGFGVRWLAHPRVKLGADVGAVVYHELQVQDDDGDELDRVTADPAPFFGLRVDFKL